MPVVDSEAVNTAAVVAASAVAATQPFLKVTSSLRLHEVIVVICKRCLCFCVALASAGLGISNGGGS